MTKAYLIVGSGPAGITAAERIRNLDSDAEIIVISEEKTPMFYRPRIPEYSVGKIGIEEIMVKKKDFYVQKKIQLHLGTRATKLDKKKRVVETSEKNIYGYDKLLIATGISPIVFTMHDLIQAERLKVAVRDAKQVVVVGGGLLGMDMAEEFRTTGLHVVFLVRRNSLGDPFFDEYGCKLIRDEFKNMEVEVITNAEVQSLEGTNNQLASVLLTDGRRFDSNLCFIAIGTTHAVDWLKDSGLKIENGVLVDRYLRSHDDDDAVFSAGNAAQIMDPVFEKHIVQTNWINAIAQGDIAGNNMAGGGLRKYETTSNYFKRVGDLFFNLIGTGNLRMKGGKRNYFKGKTPKEYVMVTTKEGRVVGAVVCGRHKITVKLKDSIEKQSDFSNMDKLIDQEEKSIEDLSKLF